MSHERLSKRHDDPETLTAGDIELNIAAHKVLVKGRPVDLTLQEFRLLQILVEYADHFMTPHELLTAAWGPDYVRDSNTLPVHILRLRTKLERHSGSSQHIRTIRGLGYIFDTIPTQASK